LSLPGRWFSLQFISGNIFVPRYKITIAYDGEPYSGWQTQPDNLTVQDIITSALEQILREDIQIIGAGRTDAGVHARGQVAHFDTIHQLESRSFLKSMYGVLPKTAAVTDIHEVPGDFHARFLASARQYSYQILTHPDPLYYRQAWENFRPLDIDKMKEAAGLLGGEHDFLSFCRKNPDQPNTMCTVHMSELEVSRMLSGLIVYHIRANRFLHNMVRRIVGTIVQVGLHKRSVGSVQELLDEPGKHRCGTTAPAQGLILDQVFYPEEVLTMKKF